MEPIVKVKNLTKKFGQFTAVDNISFEIKEGEILGFLGPNGAGKTTTIDILLGLTKPSEGEIEIFGLPLEENRTKILGRMNFSAAYVNLPWRLKVVESLYTFARLYNVANYQEKVKNLLDEFKISQFRDKLNTSLSSGQRARVYLAKAFVNNPKLLLLDEPTVFMDPDIADFTRQYILKKVRNEKMTVFFTSHNMAEVSKMCDRVIFLNKGKIIAEDTPESLAQKIRFCKVRLLFWLGKEEVSRLLENFQYKFWIEDKEMVIELEEERIGQLLGRLSLAHLKYSQITIEKPTLEDFFLKVIREEHE